MGKHSELHIADIEAKEAEDQAIEQWLREHEEDRNDDFAEDYIDHIPGAQSALDLFEKGLTKSEIKAMAASTVESVMIKSNPLQVAEALSNMECYVKEVRSDKKFTEFVREEAAKTPKGFISKSGAKIECVETACSYDFSGCNDYLLAQYEAELEVIKSNIEDRKKFLKTVPASGMDVITPDAELVKIFPPNKTSVSSYKVSLAR